MSQYRCPLFGQGNETDLESPVGGIPDSQKELIPELSDTLGGYYPLAVARDQMGEFVSVGTPDFTIPSAAKWYWRVKTWTATISFAYAPHPISASFVLKGYKGAGGSTEFTDEDELHDPLNGENAHYREWRGEALALGGPGGDDALRMTLNIGSFNAQPPTPTLDELFRERTDGDFAPRIRVDGLVDVSETDETILVPFNSIDTGAYAWGLELDALPISGLTFDHSYAPGSVTLTATIVPASFWSWGGMWNTTTGAALSNPRV